MHFRGVNMVTEQFLMDILFDMYEAYLECQGTLQNDFDALFWDENGYEISEDDYLKAHFDEVLCDEVVDAVYCQIVEDGLPEECNLDKFMNLLLSKYYVYRYNANDSVIRYIKSTKLEDIIRLFKENYDFGIDLIRTYYLSLVDNHRCELNRKVIYDNNDEDKLVEFEKNSENYKLVFLNDLLRDVICNLYNHFISNGCDDVTALSNTWAYFTDNFDPLGELDQMGVDQDTKDVYKIYMLGLILADVYEDACNDSIIDSENPIDRFADTVAIVGLTLGKIGIPKEENVRNRLLKHFILLQDERDKKYKNRKKTYEDGRIEILKKVNPTYKLDELTFSKRY